MYDVAATLAWLAGVRAVFRFIAVLVMTVNGCVTTDFEKFEIMSVGVTG